MHIIHFSDVHIGVENYSKPDSQTGLSTRLIDFLNTFDEVVEYSINNDVDLVVFSGDAYKSRDPNQTHQREFAKRIMRLSLANIPVFLLTGNHDVPHVSERATSLQIFRTLEIQNVVYADSLKIHKIDTKSGDPIQILALPWIRKSHLIAQGKNLDGKPPDEINRMIQERISNAVKEMARELDPKIPAICSAHITIKESVTSSEVSMMLGDDHGLFTNQLALPNFDYIALGHIHKHQILSKKPLMVYSGSLQRVDFGEEKDTKGFCSIILDPKANVGERIKEFNFIEVDARKFKTISISLPKEESNPTEKIVETINSESIADTILKLVIDIPAELNALIDDSIIRNALNSAHYIASITKNISEQNRSRIGEIDQKSLSPIEALELYFKSRDLSEEKTEVLLQHAIEIINQHSDKTN